MLNNNCNRMKAIKYTTYLYISIMHCQVDACLTILQNLDMSNVRCDNTSEPVTCTLTCDPGYMFNDGSTSRVYQCQNNATFYPILHKPGCLRHESPTLKMTLLVAYMFTDLAINCTNTHAQNIMQNQNNFGTRLTSVCNHNVNSSVGNISIYNITYKSSSYEIFTTYELEFENSMLSQNMIEFCGEHILANTKSGAILVYSRTSQCLSHQANISINSNMVEISTTFCPPMYQPNEDKDTTIHCYPALPLVGVKQFAYVSSFGSSVTLFCEVNFSNSSNTSVFWEHNNTNFKIDSRFNGSTIVDPSLTIYNLGNTDSGMYTCNARNEFGKSRSIPISLAVLINRSTTSVEITTSLSTQRNSSLEEVLYEDKKGIFDKYKMLFIGVGAGCGGLIILLLVVVIFIKRNKSASTLAKYEDGASITQDEGGDDTKHDELKDNLLYISSDQPIIVNDNYSVVNDDIPTAAVDRMNQTKYSVPATNSTRVNISRSDHQSTSPPGELEIQNKAFQPLDETIEHTYPANSSNDVYAVVNKTKNTDVYAEVKKQTKS